MAVFIYTSKEIFAEIKITMKKISFMILAVLCLLFNTLFAQQGTGTSKKTNEFKQSPELQTLLNAAVGETLDSEPLKAKVRPEEIAATLIDLRKPQSQLMAEINGETRFYPASVVKLFYMVALHRWLEDGKLKLTPEIERGLRDMIIDSSNDATHYILDVLTDTSSGGEMATKEFAEWSFKRNSVNRYFASQGFKNINVNQKTYCEDAYGREQQFRNYKGENRNMLTTNATARLLAEIVAGKSVSRERSRQMLSLLKRAPFDEAAKSDTQANEFTGSALKKLNLREARLWSKAGWTSKSRHDAAYVETADELKFVLVIFTENHSDKPEIIPEIASRIINKMRETEK